MTKLVYGVGVCDNKTREVVNGKQVTFKSYTCWTSMIRRCYSDNEQDKQPTYIGCTVCEEWLTYSKFKVFYDSNYIDGFQLDKDLLDETNMVYSAETCTFVPSRLNTLLSDSSASRGAFPVGVSFHKASGKYQAKCNTGGKQNSIGYYSTPEQASESYQSFKKGYVLGEITAYRESYSDNQPLMKLLDVLEDRFK